jgi:peptide/nickel transport system substrate-binding protein
MKATSQGVSAGGWCRRAVMAGASAFVLGASLLGFAGAAEAQQGDRIRKIVLVTAPQAGDPQEFQAAQLIGQEWRKLGLDVEVRAMTRQQLTDYVWQSREKWDATMWRMVGRPERSDPDELIFNLFHSTTARAGFNFVGYNNPAYDQIAEAQRREVDVAARKRLITEAQQVIARDTPYVFLVHPKNNIAYLKSVWDPKTIVDQGGIGIRNFWTFVNAAPVGTQKDMVLFSADLLVAINPLYISGGSDSWITDLVWDRLMRVGPDGLPTPWSASEVKWVDGQTLDVTLRPGQKWHDGRPMTVEDVIFSFEAVAGDESPMYKPFVSNIASIEKVSDSVVRFKLKTASASFLTSTLAKINLVPKHVWEPILQGLATSPQNAESHQERQPIGSGPFKVARFALTEEVVLEKNADHWSAPKMDRWILRIVTNQEAALGMLRRGEVNFLSDYRGDPKILDDLARQNANVEVASSIDMGFRFVGLNNRRPPFDDVKFRQALSLAINRNLMVQAAWNGYAVPSGSVVSPALAAWHVASITRANLDEAKKTLADAGYALVQNRLHYPSGKRETLTAE